MASKSTPRIPKNLEKCYTLVVVKVFISFGKMAPKIPKKSPRCSQKSPKLPILGSKLAILGTSWRQVGQQSGILAHPGAIMRPTRPPNGAPDASQIASWAILAPRGIARELQQNTSALATFHHTFQTTFPTTSTGTMTLRLPQPRTLSKGRRHKAPAFEI